MNRMSSLVVFLGLLVIVTTAEARSFKIPKLSELHSESDVVMVATLKSVGPTATRRGNAVEAVARLEVHMLLKGKCGDEVELEHLIASTDLPGVEIVPYGNGLRTIEWNTGLKQGKEGVLEPKERKLYFIFAKRTEKGGLSVYRSKTRDCYGVFELDGSDSKLALFMIAEDESFKEDQLPELPKGNNREGGGQ